MRANSVLSATLKQIGLPSFYGGAYAPKPKDDLIRKDAENGAKIIAAINARGYPMTRKEICTDTDMTAAIASRVLTNMRLDGKLTCHGQRSLARWAVA